MGFSLQWLVLLQSMSSRHAGSIVVAHGLIYSKTCGIFSEQGSNPCSLHCKGDSWPSQKFLKTKFTGQSVSSVAQLCPTLCNPMDCSTPGFPVHHQFPELAQTHVHWVSDAFQPSHLILCRPLLLPPSFFPSIRVFSSESVLRIRWPKYWSFSFNISPSNEYSGLISFSMDWLDLLAVQGTLKSLLQRHSSKAWILWLSFLYSSALTSILHYWKNLSFD